MKLINAIVLNLIYMFPYAAGSDSDNVSHLDNLNVRVSQIH